eukprot:2376081-Amphidinium_carterae.2
MWLHLSLLDFKLKNNEFEEDGSLTSKDKPHWRRLGFELSEPEQVAASFAVEPELESEVVDVEVAELAQGAEGQMASKQARKTMVLKPTQQWFATWAKHMMSNHQWWFRDCLRCAQEWCPHVHGGVHSDTPRRWLKALEDEEKAKAVAGRKQKVQPQYWRSLAP